MQPNAVVPWWLYLPTWLQRFSRTSHQNETDMCGPLTPRKARGGFCHPCSAFYFRSGTGISRLGDFKGHDIFVYFVENFQFRRNPEKSKNDTNSIYFSRGFSGARSAPENSRLGENEIKSTDHCDHFELNTESNLGLAEL